MEQQIEHHKDNLLRDYTPRVLYVIVFFAMIELFLATYIRFVVEAFSTISYRDNLADMPIVTAIFQFIFIAVFYYANRKTFEIIKKDSFGLWMKHLGIDMALFALSILLTVIYNNLEGKVNPGLGSVESLMVFFVFYFKHHGMRWWYKKQSRKLKVVE
jgi:hypothetical protein